MKHIDNNKSSYDGMIILTDGEAGDPGPPLRGVRRCWVMPRVSSYGFVYMQIKYVS